jgi:hypothetical protein
MGATAKEHLTEKLIGKLAAKATAYFVRDDKIKGLLIRVMPTRKDGTVQKYFDFECRVNGAKYRRTLGRWPGLSLQEAQRLAAGYRSQIDQDIDPFKAQAERAAAEAIAKSTADAEMDLAGLIDRYFRDHAIPGQKAASSIEADRRNARNHIPPDWYARKLSSFVPADFENLRAHIRGNAETKAVRGRERPVGGPIMANRVIALLKTMFNLAAKWGELKGGNPAARIDKYKERRRTFVYSNDDLARLDVELAKEDLPWQRYFGLVLSTATRKSEWLQARWDGLDLVENIVTINHVKRGENHPLVIALNTGARQIINGMLAERASRNPVTALRTLPSNTYFTPNCRLISCAFDALPL